MPWSPSNTMSIIHSRSTAQNAPHSVTAMRRPREALEHAREHHEPERARRPEAHLGRVHADEARGRCRSPRAARSRSACAPASGAPRTPPTPGRTGVVVRRVLTRHRRDEDAAAQARLAGAADLGDRGIDVVVDRHQRDAAAPLGALVAELGEPAVVGTRAPAMSSTGSCWLLMPRPAPNGAELPPSTASASGKITSPTTPSASSSLSRRGRVPAAREALFVLGEPLLLELLVAHDLELLSHRLALGEVRVERVEELRVEVGAVLLVGQAGVTVRRDDHVAVGHRDLCYSDDPSFFGTFQGDGATRYSGSLASAHRRGTRVDRAARPVAREVDPEPVGEDALDRDVGHLFERRERQLLAVNLELRDERRERVAALGRCLAGSRVALGPVATRPPDPGVERAGRARRRQHQRRLHRRSPSPRAGPTDTR